MLKCQINIKLSICAYPVVCIDVSCVGRCCILNQHCGADDVRVVYLL
jgi:hypothetical protein